MSDVKRAARAIADGDLAVYPTETVYGMGANAVDAEAVERVFEVKGRDRDKPVSLGVPSVERATEYVDPTERELRFMRAFLPGPVTVVVQRRDVVPDVLTAGRERVGVRVPDHDLALDLFEAAGVPVTATSANLSGTGSVRELDELSDEVRDRVSAMVDGGRTDGMESTVVDAESGDVHRRGAMADEIEAWLADHADTE
ncbi:DNA binding protein, translation factor [Halosimplex carlsbadense 2-9-1]|uniref:L-threonylcarbamoyladenylate synthase n=1 Tax=Halosimplex carlsbadense 2-9-1 TaxID=797114 RepID=M0D182_9EURY|nr:L-threonylcarbamoyladenylate synthase [Halosimplex carlsbadense]ELZ29271.1 DNA binding protein, translation factor [Halosimplex carlsbadense 2-9-1]